MRTMKKRTRDAAHEYLEKCFPLIRRSLQASMQERMIVDLVESAFALYEGQWNLPHQASIIAGWNWPYQVMYGEARADGDEPWTVLLRHAICLYHALSTTLTTKGTAS